jgi:molybdopterin/thiamine biosynthesis adenylyltransferase/dimeric dUTPase (all-alpha-NTP-PPase superfamily)
MYLAASGIGTLVLNDFDRVDLHNLQRQVVHTTNSIGNYKTSSAKQQLLQLNPDCRIVELARQLDEPELAKEISSATVVVDCTDNFAMRQLLNRLCHQHRTPLVSGAAIRFEGQVTVFHYQNDSDACYQCLYPGSGADDASCTANGVLAPLVGVIGSLQAVEVIKLLAGIGETLRNRLLIYDALHQQVRIVNYKKDVQCPVCGRVVRNDKIPGKSEVGMGFESERANQIQVMLELMLELQDSMNRKVHPEWRTQGYDWYRAIWVECAELMNHYGWKWWKKQQPDMEQVRLELIDIWHFGLSYLLNTTSLSVQELASAIEAELELNEQEGDFRLALESFTQWTLVHRAFSVSEFAALMSAARLEFPELYVGYISKNVLNFFRQDHGYKQGTYIKQWNGREDNEHLVEICASLDATSASFKDELYAGLKARYQDVVRGG